MSDYNDHTEERKPLHRIFTAVPPRYDLVNHIITLGMDSGWRREAAKTCLAGNPKEVLDLCCGTGDLILDLARLSKGKIELTGLDFSEPMLAIASRKSQPFIKDGNVSFVCGNAAELPFPDGSFDCAGISFAFRNLTYKNPLVERHLAEVWRVLADGGRYVIVESSQPKWQLIRLLDHLYVRTFVFGVGWLVSGNRGAYRYLSESAARFYTPEEIARMLKDVGFREVSYRPLFMGAAGIHVAVK